MARGLIYDSPLSRVQAGADFVTGLFDQRATLDAGRLASQGDYGGAAGILDSRGMSAEAGGLIKRQRDMDSLATRKKALTSIDTGDYAGARSTAAAAGDTDLYSATSTLDADHEKQVWGFLKQGTEALAKVPEARRVEAFDSAIAPTLQQAKVDPARITSMRDALARAASEGSSDTLLRSYGADISKKLSIHPLGTDQGIYDENMNLVRRDPGGVKPEYIQVDPEKDLYVAGGGAQGGPAPVGAPPADAVGALLTEAYPGVKVTSATRTPERNAEVGGAPNSYHLSGHAVDISLAPGVTKETIRSTLEGQGYKVRELLGPGDKGHDDHFHVAFDAPAGSYDVASNGGPTMIRKGAPKSAEAPEWVRDTSPEGVPILRNTKTHDEKPAPGTGAGTQKITDGARQTAALAYRAVTAAKQLDDLNKEGLRKPSRAFEFKRDVLGRGEFQIRSEADARFAQAAKEWLAPVLRKDTGAAVTDTELETYMDIYIPRSTDSDAILLQKANARVRAMRGLIASSGGAYEAEPAYRNAPKVREAAVQRQSGASAKVIKFDQNGNVVQ